MSGQLGKGITAFIIFTIISCGGKRAAVGVKGLIDSFTVGGYTIEAYGNVGYSAEDWIYRFKCRTSNGEERRFELRTKIIESRQFYLCERISDKWKAIVYFPGKPGYAIVKQSQTGEIVHAAEQLKLAEPLQIKFADGEVTAIVRQIGAKGRK